MTPIPHRKLPLRVRFPYVSRIVVQIEDTVVELARFRRRVLPSDWHCWADGRENRCWVEQPMPDSETITCRPGARRFQRARYTLALPRGGRCL